MRAGFGVWGLPKQLLLASAFRSLPQLLQMCRGGKLIGLDEASLIIRLNALGRFIGRESTGRHKFLLFDEGAVFALAKLRALGETRGANGGDERRLRDLVARRAVKLDVIVWLDAPDEILARRIREREKPHRMKNRSDKEISDFLARYREGYERVVSELGANHKLKVIRVSTDGATPEQIAGEVLSSMTGGEG